MKKKLFKECTAKCSNADIAMLYGEVPTLQRVNSSLISTNSMTFVTYHPSLVMTPIDIQSFDLFAVENVNTLQILSSLKINSFAQFAP